MMAVDFRTSSKIQPSASRSLVYPHFKFTPITLYQFLFTSLLTEFYEHDLNPELYSAVLGKNVLSAFLKFREKRIFIS